MRRDPRTASTTTTAISTPSTVLLLPGGLPFPLATSYIFFNVVPSWAMMLVVSFISRSMMFVFAASTTAGNLSG